MRHGAALGARAIRAGHLARRGLPGDGRRRKTLVAGETAEWFRARGCPAFSLADMAGSEGTFGLVLQVTVKVEARPTLGAFLLSFDQEARALEAAAWVASASAAGAFP